MATTKIWRVWGRPGHRQRESFNESYCYNFSNDHDGERIISVLNADATGSNAYSILIIRRDTEALCDAEFEGQLSDGIFENSRVGDTELVTVYND